MTLEKGSLHSFLQQEEENPLTFMSFDDSSYTQKES